MLLLAACHIIRILINTNISLRAQSRYTYYTHTHTHTLTNTHTYIHIHTHVSFCLPHLLGVVLAAVCAHLFLVGLEPTAVVCAKECALILGYMYAHTDVCMHACKRAKRACVRASAASVVEPAQTQAKREQRVGTLARIPAVAPSWGVCLLLASIVLRLTSPPIAHRGRGRQQGYVLEARSVRLLCLGRSIVRCARIFLVSLHASRRQPPSWHRTPSSVPRRPRDTRLFRGTFPARPSKVHTSECWSASHVLTMCVLSVRACACRNRRRAASRSPLAATRAHYRA